MSKLISDPPILENISINNKFSGNWQRWFDELNFNLGNYLTQYNSKTIPGRVYNTFNPPPLTTVQRDDLMNPLPGTMIYNSNTMTIQAYLGGVWVDL
jgi:hypothetical protein